MLVLQNISYTHSNKECLFDNIHLTVNDREKIALNGNNGTGKSTLLKIIAGELHPSGGQLNLVAQPYYVPQIFGQYNHLNIAQALRIESKLDALKEILAGNVTEENYTLLDDDWTMRERCTDALKHWQLTDLDLSQKMETLSGGQKTKVFLAGISIHQPDLVLLDEPSNHLDSPARQILYDFIQSAQGTLIVVSHDGTLLNLLNTVCELGKQGLRRYGGNYNFYAEQKQIEKNALNQDLSAAEKALRKAKEKERDTVERQQKLNARGKKKQEKAGVARIMINTLRNNAEKSTSKVKTVHAEKISGIAQELQGLRSILPGIDKMKFGFNHSELHKGKILFTAKDINYTYNRLPVWADDLCCQIISGERIALKGPNASGKTTLIKLILGDIKPQTGTVYLADNKSVYMTRIIH